MIYENAGYRTYRPETARYGDNDVFGLFDLLALTDGGLDMVQVKATDTHRGATGIEAFCRDTIDFQSTRGLCPVYMVCYDREGWRFILPSDKDSWVDVVDERELSGRMGEGVTAYLKGGVRGE